MNVKKGLLCAILILGVTSSAFSHNTKSSTTAVMLGVIIPAGGQVYNRQYIKAACIWGGLIVSGIIIGSPDLVGDHDDAAVIIGGTGFGGVWLYSIFDAAWTADRLNMESYRRFGLTPTITPKRIGTMLSYRF